MSESIHYYCVGFKWGDESQLPRFLREGIWENGYDDYYEDRVNEVPVKSRIAAKTTYTRKEKGETISVLEIHALGTVTKNPKDGRTLIIEWDKDFKSFIIDGKGAYRSTISRVLNSTNIDLIFGERSKRVNKSKTEGEIVCYSYENYKSVDVKYPCFVFIKHSWDDYGYRTLYTINYYESSRNKIDLGHTKILRLASTVTNVPDEFSLLSDDYCSLGQSTFYYEKIRDSLSQDVYQYFLDAINDAAYNRGLLEDFEHEDGFKTSLIRESEAQKALTEGIKILLNIPIDNAFMFSFSTQIGTAVEQHKIDFDFVPQKELPNRINVIIGKNGTGKTQFISRLASTLSGQYKNGEFSTKYVPPFSRVLAISYSLFDKFPKPVRTKTFSYFYCGFQSEKSFLTEGQIQNKIVKALKVLEKSKRIRLLGSYLSLMHSDDLVTDILDEEYLELQSNDFSLYDNNGNSKYSSGQIISILVLSEILAYIREESLLIIDEPETHLHPNSISLFLDVLYRVLKKFNSYAIIATHSPQIIQEVPSRYIRVLDRIDDITLTRNVDIETFGENLSTITERIFQTQGHDEFYRSYLTELARERSYEYIVALFKKKSLPLSLNAKVFLQSLYITNEKSDTTAQED